jgi:hypothetical protein
VSVGLPRERESRAKREESMVVERIVNLVVRLTSALMAYEVLSSLES